MLKGYQNPYMPYVLLFKKITHFILPENKLMIILLPVELQ